MNRVYLVRHGENRANLTKELSHKTVDYSLTPKGILQAQQTATFFSDKNIHDIYASPLKRAMETAEIIGERLSLPVTVMEQFREVNVGDLEGRADKDAWAIYFQIAEDWFTTRPETAFPGGEDYHTLWGRMRAGILRIVAGKTGRNIVVVGHGGIFTVTMKDLCRDVDLVKLRGGENYNCSISELAVALHDDALDAELISWALCTHLSGEAAALVAGVPDEHAAERRLRGA
jgi:broad specificity phosphatase PhoE